MVFRVWIMQCYNLILQTFGVLPIRIVKSHVSNVGEKQTKGQQRANARNVILLITTRIGSTPTFLFFDLYLYSAYAAN